jgi:hypothetical protein
MGQNTHCSVRLHTRIVFDAVGGQPKDSPMTKTNFLHLLGALFFALACGLASTASATTFNFANSQAISIPKAGTNPPAGQGDPYPSEILVSGIPEDEFVVDINLTLSGLSHDNADDLYFVLEAPTGESIVLWNDAGGNFPLFGVTVIFDDGAVGAIPNSGPVVSGDYQVSQYGSIPGPDDTFPAPNPGFGGDLSLFNGDDPNGTWKLYAYDDSFFGGKGELSDGWALTFETQPIPEPTAALLFAVGAFVVGGALRRQRA